MKERTGGRSRVAGADGILAHLCALNLRHELIGAA